MAQLIYLLMIIWTVISRESFSQRNEHLLSHERLWSDVTVVHSHH